MTATATTTADRLDRLATRTEAPPAFRLRGRAHKVALSAHVLTSVGWFGIAVAIALCGIAAAATGDDALSGSLRRTMAVAPWLTIPMGVASALTGVLLGLGTAHGLVRHWWVVAKEVVMVAVVVTDGVLVAPVAHHAATTGSATPPLYGSTIAHVVLLGAATVLSVFKPRGRTPWGARRRT
jgi:hypothetical protein